MEGKFDNLKSFVGAVLTDLSKALIAYHRLIARLSAYGSNNDSLCYIYSYLKDRKQCVQINNKESEFDTITSGVPQGSVFGPILLNIFFNHFFFLIPKASVHNFADNDTLIIIHLFQFCFTNST